MEADPSDVIRNPGPWPERAGYDPAADMTVNPAEYVTELFRAHHLELVRLAVLLAVSLMNEDFPADPVAAIQVLDLATGATRTWTAAAHSVYIPGPPSWADGSRVIAFTWLRSTRSGLMAAPRGIQLLDTAAPGDNLPAGWSGCSAPRRNSTTRSTSPPWRTASVSCR
jgi:hypothetical protein